MAMAELLVTSNQCLVKTRFVGLGNGRAHGSKALDFRSLINSIKPLISPRTQKLEQEAEVVWLFWTAPIVNL
jgi:hypothetical protein